MLLTALIVVDRFTLQGLFHGLVIDEPHPFRSRRRGENGHFQGVQRDPRISSRGRKEVAPRLPSKGEPGAFPDLLLRQPEPS